MRLYTEHFNEHNPWTVTFFGHVVAHGECRTVTVYAGETLFIPSGWIHAIFAPVDSIAFGGHFIHHLDIPMQLKYI